MNWKDVERRGHALINVTRRNLPGEKEKNFEKLLSG
jgi:hypothetical protein